MKFLQKTVTTLTLAALLGGPSVAFAARSYYMCSAPRSGICYVTIFTPGSMRNFTMHSGTGDWLGGLRPGDTYCHSYVGPNNPNTCNRIPIPMHN